LADDFGRTGSKKHAENGDSEMIRQQRTKLPPFVFLTCRRRVDGLAPQTNHHVNANDLVALRRLGSFAEHNVRWRNVNQFVSILDVVMLMLRIVGIKIRLGRVDCDLSQKTDLRKLVQRVVDGRE
jgi:hypothetical protein